MLQGWRTKDWRFAISATLTYVILQKPGSVNLIELAGSHGTMLVRLLELSSG